MDWDDLKFLLAVADAGGSRPRRAALADTGVCMVPCYLAAAHASLVRLTDQVLATSEVYAVFLPERRGEPRLRVLIDALLEMFERERAALSGTVADA